MRPPASRRRIVPGVTPHIPKPPVVALHGFSLTGEMFGEIATALGGHVAAPDLPGHGAAARVPATVDAAIATVTEEITGAGGRTALLGYSLGGRIALRLALDRPELVTHLVLVSASAGIADPAARRARLTEDRALADRIERIGTAAFVDEWLARVLFAGLAARGAEWRASDRARRLANGSGGLAAAVRGLGQGAMPFMGDRLGELAMPVLVVAGERDGGYVAAAREMASGIRDASLVVIPDAGHSVVGEAPAALAKAIGRFLDSP